MSILAQLLKESSKVTFLSWQLDDTLYEDIDPEVEFNCRIVIPADKISDAIWYELDCGHTDPDTGTIFYSRDFDGTDSEYWGSFNIIARGLDTPLVLKYLKEHADVILDWLTARRE